MLKGRTLLLVLVLAVFAAVAIAQDFCEPPVPRWIVRDSGKQIAPPKSDGKIYTNEQLLEAMKLGGDMLCRTQHTDGGWREWKVDPNVAPVLSDASHLNQFGVNARALVLLSTKVKNSEYDYQTYAQNTKYWNMNLPLYYYFDSNTNQWKRSYFYSTDRVFMGEYATIFNSPDARVRALAEWEWVKGHVGYFATAQSLVQQFVQIRANANMIKTYGLGLILWDIGGYADGCLAVGDPAYANALLDLLINQVDWTPAPGDPYWNSGNGYSKSLFNNFLKRWDDGTPALGATDSTYVEWMFVSAAGQLLQAFANVDSAKYKPQIDALKSRLANDCQIVNTSNPYYGAYSYRKLGWEGLGSQDNGYACMGMRRVGEIAAGRLSTDFLIRTQITDPGAIYYGGWMDADGFFYLEPTAEALQGMWEISEGEDKPWVKIASNPPGHHINDVPFAVAIYDLQADPAALMFEWTKDDGINWFVTDKITGTTTSLTTSPTGSIHSLRWWTNLDGINYNANCKLRITARDNDDPTGWGAPAGVTETFSVDNGTTPVQLSVFSLE